MRKLDGTSLRKGYRRAYARGARLPQRLIAGHMPGSLASSRLKRQRKLGVRLDGGSVIAFPRLNRLRAGLTLWQHNGSQRSGAPEHCAEPERQERDQDQGRSCVRPIMGATLLQRFSRQHPSAAVPSNFAVHRLPHLVCANFSYAIAMPPCRNFCVKKGTSARF